MTAVRDSGGSTNSCRTGEFDVKATSSDKRSLITHHRPVSPSPFIREYRDPHGGEPHGGEASSPECSKFSSSRAAACDGTDLKPEPEVKGSAGRNTEMVRKISATGGRQGRYQSHKPHGSEVPIVSSSVAPSVDKEQWRLPTRIDSSKTSVILENIRLQKTRQTSQLQRGGGRDPQVSGKKNVGADSNWRDPHVSRKKNEVSDHRYWQTDTVSSRISSGMSVDSINGWRFPKVSKEEDKLACDSKLELIDAPFKKPLDLSPREPIRFHLRRRPSIVDRRGALDAVNESRLLEGHNLNIGRPKPKLTWEGETYMTTLGPGGGYGYPHPPPFYKCEVCFKETACYRLRCCHMVVCECCGCACESAEVGKDKRLQYQREQLPKVKLEGSNLFLWQPCSFPDRQMLWKAKRTENHLEYYFAPIHKLMYPSVDRVEVCVYDFCQQGHDVISLSKTEKFLARNLLY